MTRYMRTAVLGCAVMMAGSALAVAQDGYYDRGGYDRGYNYGGDGFRVARDIGFEDGSRVAQQDIYHRKPFAPYPRGKYAHEDRGYHRYYGDKYAYMEQYSRAYREGYERTFRRY